MLLFNSRNIEYKKPFGAVRAGENVCIKFPVNKSISLVGVSLILRQENIVKNIQLRFLGDEKDSNVFVGGFSPKSEGIYFYRFEIYTLEGTIFVGKGRDGSALIGDWLPEWQLTVYQASFKTPEWIKGGIIYHIFPDRFCRIEDGKRPARGVFKSWYQMLSIGDQRGYCADDFYGGNINGVISKLPYLKSLGITAIYFSPIFESSSNHRYDTGDYFRIDPLFGDEEQFRILIEKAKELGIGIILDGVFNHTGADSLYFNKFGNYKTIGAYQSKDSKYYDWYTFSDWPDEYDCWWGVTVVPSIRRNAKAYQEMIVGESGVIDKWTKMGVKGWRLDVVDELSSDFVSSIYKAGKSISSEILVIGEVWEDASVKESYGEKRKYVFGEQLDGVMNYPFMSAILDLLKMKHTECFINTVYDICENYPKCILDTCMTLLDSHDTVRAITALGVVNAPKTKFARSIYRLSPDEYKRGKKLLKMASLIQYVLPGVPTVYYGDETGMQGYEDPMNRATFPVSGGDPEIISHYCSLGSFRLKFKDILVKSGINIFSLDKVLHIIRGKLHTVVNLSEETFALGSFVKNQLNGEMVKLLKKENAIVFLDENI